MGEAEFLDERYPERPAQLRARWRKAAMAEYERRQALRQAAAE